MFLSTSSEQLSFGVLQPLLTLKVDSRILAQDGNSRRHGRVGVQARDLQDFPYLHRRQPLKMDFSA